MAPKAAKRGSAKKPNTPGGGRKNGEAGLTKAPFDEDSWRACVSLVVGGSPEEEELIQALISAVQQPQRKLFSVISWDSTLAKIHELGNPKTKKTDGTPMYYEVTEPAKVLLDAGAEISCDLMAKIVKFQLLHVKTNDQQRREAEQEKAAPCPLEPSKEKKTKLKRRDEVEPPVYIDDEPDSGPQHYVLLLGFYQPQLIGALDAVGVHVANVIKLCSEHLQSSAGRQEQSYEENDQSLRESSVPGAEDKDCEVKLAVKLDLFWSRLRAVLDSGPPESKLHDVVQLSYTVPDLLLPVHTQNPEAVLELGSRIFGGVAKLIYASLDWRRQHQHYRDNVKLIDVHTVTGLDSQPGKDLPAVLQKESRPDQETKLPPLSVDVDMCYYSNLLDLVPPEACSVPLILHCMLEQVVISTEQPLQTAPHVVAETKPVSSCWPDYERVSYMLQTFWPLVHTEEERSHMLNSLLTTVQDEEDKKRLVEKFGAKKTENSCEQLLVIRLHDERALRLRNISEVQGLDPVKVELSMMKMTPVWDLIQSVAQQSRSSSCWMSIRQQLQHYCTDDMVSWPEVERLFHQSVFEAMPLSRLDQQGVLVDDAGPLGTLEPAQQQTSVNPWDNPAAYAKHQLHNLQDEGPAFLTEDSGNSEYFSERVNTQLKLSDLQSCRLRCLFDWHYAEHHDVTVLPQVLQSASEEYRCLDSFRGSNRNILYIFCHNPMNPQRQSKEFWNETLHTDVKFRKYLEHVADTISNWTVEEELKREAQQVKNDSPTDPPKDECPVEEEETQEAVIRKDSLKAWKLEQARLKEEETTKKSKKENAAKGKQQKEKQEDKKKSKTSSAGKKSRPQTTGSSAKTPTKSCTVNGASVDENKELQQTNGPSNSFTGYSMDGKLVHVSGRLQHLFPSDGGKITVETFSFVEGSNHMIIDVKKDGHHFYTHINQIVVDPAKPPSHLQDNKPADPQEDCKVFDPVEMRTVKQGSFSAMLDNRIQLSYSFYGPTGEQTVSSEETKGRIPETSIVDPVPPSSSPHHSKETDLESQTSSSQTRPPEFKDCEDQPALTSNQFNSLSLSVPNGLVLQFLRDDTRGLAPEESGVLVRQSFPVCGGGEMKHLQDVSLSRELSRLITSQGAVIRSMRDGSTEVLFADGSVSFSRDSGPVWVSDSEVQDENSHQEAEDEEKEQKSEEEAEAQRGCWLTTAPSGERICTVGTSHKQIPTTSLLSFQATDPISHQVMLTREDLVVSVKNPDGSLIVEHADGTRITSIQDAVQTCGKLSESLRMCDYRERAGSSPAKSGKPETEEEDFPAKERVVLVEKEGSATVVMYPERHTAHVFLADGTVITGTNQAEYQVFPSSAGLLHIQRDGKCLYSSDPGVTPSPKGCPPTNQAGTYTMSHTDKVACDLTEPDGNHFQVMDDGQTAAVIFSPAPSTFKHDDDEEEEEELEEEEDREIFRLHDKHREHCPRLFLVHEDGSGTELLNSGSVEEQLYQALSDRSTALLKEPLPETQDEYSITILKPSHQSVFSQWLLSKQNPDIRPANLRNRSWNDFPNGKNKGLTKKSPRPPFGSDLGPGLTLSSGGSVRQHQPVRSCPKVLEMREIKQHRPFTTPLRNTIDSRLKEYIESLMEREKRSEEMKVKDPRSEEEKNTQTGDLLTHILCFTEEDNTSQHSDQKLPVDVARLYIQGAGAEKSGVSEDTTTTHTDSLEDIKYIGNRKDSKWTERRAQNRQEICEERTHREALRKNSVVPYFHPENISLFESLLEPQIPDMRRISMDPPDMRRISMDPPDMRRISMDPPDMRRISMDPPDMRRISMDPPDMRRISMDPPDMRRISMDPPDMRRISVDPPDMRRISVDLPAVSEPDGADGFLKDAPAESTLRPLNPTPSQSSSHPAGSSRTPGYRPINPTPHTAGESSLRASSKHSVPLDVTGKPRRSKVRLPNSILSSKPYTVPNQQFLTVEEPVRRKCRTVSLTNPSFIVRGFQLLPDRVDFGTLQEGSTSTVSVVMRNVGVDTCRFHVKPPPPGTGLRIIYKPGPVAAGLQVELQLQLFAMCAAQTGEVELKKFISHDVVINTERDVFYLPVTATILAERFYEIWLQECSSVHKKRSSRIIHPSRSSGSRAQMNKDPPDGSCSKHDPESDAHK